MATNHKFKLSKIHQRKRKRRNQTYRAANQIHNYLKKCKHKIKFQKLRGLCGLYDEDTKTITLDYRKDLIPTLIHEIIHHWHIDWCESKVIKEERRIVGLLTPTQIKKILKLMAQSF